MSDIEHLDKIQDELDTVSASSILALAEARRMLGDSSPVTQELLHLRIAVTNAQEALELIKEKA